MQKNLPGLSSFTVIIFSFFFFGCTKIDTTTLGSDIIPAVDNVHTFESILPVTGEQGIFNDSTRLAQTDLHLLGSISNDPVFGKTQSDLFLQLKPGFFPFYFGNAGDTVSPGTGFDSVVLCLSYNSFYGDTTLPQHLSVYQVDNTIDFVDSSYKISFHPNYSGPKLGEITVKPTDLRAFTFFYSGATNKDSVTNQIRIPLTDPAFLELLTSVANRDTANSDGIYRSDALFKEKLKGFAVVADPVQGNGLFYISLTNAATRLEFHYHKKNNNITDSTSTFFYFSTGISASASAHATHLERDRSIAEYNPAAPTTDVLYIQASPGTYANLSIPGLAALPNCIIHRAEIFVEQVPSGALDSTLTPPLYLYLDLIDTISGNPDKPIYYDLNPSSSYNPDASTTFFPGSGIDFNYFGGYRRIKNEGGVTLYYYNLNVSRYVQHIVTNHLHNYSMKLYAPYNLHYQGFTIPFNNNVANGRIKVGNGNNANDSYRMKMRIVYTKI